MSRVTTFAWMLVAFAACSKPSEDKPADQKAIKQLELTDPSAPTPAAAARATPAPTRGGPPYDVRQMIGAMQYQAEHRPTEGLRAEQVLDAFDKIGVEVEERRQFLGNLAQASFCAGGVTKDHLNVSVCEYPDAKAAQAGLEHMNKYFGGPGFQRTINKSTVVTLAGTPGKLDQTTVNKAFQTFLSL